MSDSTPQPEPRQNADSVRPRMARSTIDECEVCDPMGRAISPATRAVGWCRHPFVAYKGHPAEAEPQAVHWHTIPVDASLTVEEAWRELCLMGVRATNTGSETWATVECDGTECEQIAREDQ